MRAVPVWHGAWSLGWWRRAWGASHIRRNTMKTQLTKQMNGLDLQQMTATIDLLKKDSSLAQFEFRARNRWLDGGHNRSEIDGFYGAGREDESRTESFVFDNGEPPVLLGGNEGANPVEFVLHALAGCVTTTTVLHAAARGIKIKEISTELEGDIDVRTLVGLSDTLPSGYQEIRVKMNVKADCSDEELDDLCNDAWSRSPVFGTITNPVPIQMERVRS
jgi:uncharacterized OsmC-like protein